MITATPQYGTSDFFLPTPAGSVYVLAHEVSPTRPAVVISPGAGATFSEPRYFFSILGRRLAEIDCNVYLYDHPGMGDSPPPGGECGLIDMVAAARSVVDHARRNSSRVAAVIGYGLGNVVAAALHGDAPSRATVAIGAVPPLPSDIVDSLLIHDDMVIPEVFPLAAAQSDVWRLIYGEPVVPSQPPAPVSLKLLSEVLKFGLTADTGTAGDLLGRVVVITDVPADHWPDAEVLLIEHQPTAERPSWQWDMHCRDEIANHVCSVVSQEIQADRGAAATRVDANAPRAPELSSNEVAVIHRIAHVSGSDGHVMRGILSSPSVTRAEPDRRRILIYETGNPGQRVDIHGLGPLLARSLAQAGWSTFRYDPTGMGVSNGPFDQMTWSTRVEDCLRVCDFLRDEGYEEFVLLGNSSGARVALDCARRVRGMLGSLLWGPILQEADDGNEAGRASLIRTASGLATEWCGLPLGLGYQRDRRQRDDLSLLRQQALPMCIIFANDEPDLVNRDVVLGTVRNSASATVLSAPGQHGFSWAGLQVALAASVGWLTTLTGDTKHVRTTRP